MRHRQYYFIRHALPVNDAGSLHLSVYDRDMLGKVDEQLSEKGKQQAVALKNIMHNLGIERIVSSTRKRAMETAAIISEATGIPYDARFDKLDEISLGSTPVKKNILVRTVMSRHWPAPMHNVMDQAMIAGLTLYYFLKWRLGKTRGGETLSEINRKVDEMLAVLNALPERRIAVVGHAGWISFLAVRILGGSLWHFIRLSRVDNCAITRIDANGPGNYKLRYFAKNHRSLG
ncbi:MAG: histidine phosphatase family protein [Desulfobacteraceae bacterium]|nr:MAG: histidine phosphatase family protein [Desulfobacteraceae bacterium]